MKTVTLLGGVVVLALLAATIPMRALRFVVCGDCRASLKDIEQPFPKNIINTDVLNYGISQIVALNPKPAFVMFLGDGITYALPKARGLPPEYSSNLEYFKSWMTNALQGIPLYMVVGNEDLNSEDGPEWQNQVAFANTFSNMPNNGPTDPVDFRHLAYSFEYGTGTEKSFFGVFDSFGFYWDDTVYTTTQFCNNDVDPIVDPSEDDPSASLAPNEQINWMAAQASASTANHKFMFTHGPTFLVVGGLLVSVGQNMSRMWDVALNNNFDTYFCAHQHLFYRWNVGVKAYPTAVRPLIQTVAGSLGASPVTAASANGNPNGRIYFGYNYVVVDVDGPVVAERAYAIAQNANGGFTQQLFDTSIIVK